MFLKAAKRTPVNLAEWGGQMMERSNRKSQHVPELSPTTKSFLRGESQPSPKEAVTSGSTNSNPTFTPTTSNSAFTPTSGVIPIAEDDTRPTPITAIQRDPYSEINDIGMYPSQTTSFDRQGFPPRTSSNLSGPPSGRSRDGEAFTPSGGLPNQLRDSGNFNPTTTLPIRPAPPPSGPLPQPPTGSFRNSAGRRPVPNGLPYQYDNNQKH